MTHLKKKFFLLNFSVGESHGNITIPEFEVKQWKHQVQSENSELCSETLRNRKQLKNKRGRHNQRENTELSQLGPCPKNHFWMILL